jgi:impB/mucB/samB family
VAIERLWLHLGDDRLLHRRWRDRRHLFRPWISISHRRTRSQSQFPGAVIEHHMNLAKYNYAVLQWMFLNLNALSASCEQQENPTLRGKPVIVAQTRAESAVAIASSHAPKAFGIKTGAVVRNAGRHSPRRHPGPGRSSALHLLSERVPKEIEKVMSIDEMAIPDAVT